MEVAEKYRFHRCVQEENECVSAYSARLRRYASTCNFGEFLNRSLCDQFICRIRNSATRKKLLNEDHIFQDALKVATADEVANKETLEVQNDAKPGDESVHLMGKSRIPWSISNSRNPLNQHNQNHHYPHSKNLLTHVILVEVLNILEPSVDFEMLLAVDVNALAILLVFAKKVTHKIIGLNRN